MTVCLGYTRYINTDHENPGRNDMEEWCDKDILASTVKREREKRELLWSAIVNTSQL